MLENIKKIHLFVFQWIALSFSTIYFEHKGCPCIHNYGDCNGIDLLRCEIILITKYSTTGRCPSRAAICRAVDPFESFELTSRSSCSKINLTWFKSPWVDAKISDLTSSSFSEESFGFKTRHLGISCCLFLFYNKEKAKVWSD